MNTIIKLAHQFSAYLAGFEHGEYDCQLNQWGDSRASFGAWRRKMQEEDRWDEALNGSYSEYKTGYEKALIHNKGIGMTADPDDHQLWEEPHHPWGENKSRIKPEHRSKVR